MVPFLCVEKTTVIGQKSQCSDSLSKKQVAYPAFGIRQLRQWLLELIITKHVIQFYLFAPKLFLARHLSKR